MKKSILKCQDTTDQHFPFQQGVQKETWVQAAGLIDLEGGKRGEGSCLGTGYLPQSQPGVQIRAAWGCLTPCHLAASPLTVLQHQDHGQCGMAGASSALSAPLSSQPQCPARQSKLWNNRKRALYNLEAWKSIYLFIPLKSYFNSINLLCCRDI